MSTRLDSGTCIGILVFIIIALSGCTEPGPESPYLPPADDGGASSSSQNPPATGDWPDVLAADSNYPDNVYLTECVAFNPGPAGGARVSMSPEYYDADGHPLDSTKMGACGPPEGSKAIYSSDCTMSVLGSGGSAVWRFDPAWVIIDGPGDDFLTFSNHNILNGNRDGSWNELAHVYASEDGVNWYKSSKEQYLTHPAPGTANEGYFWDQVEDVHGNNHSWANFRKEIEAEQYSGAESKYVPVETPSGEQVYISRYFTPLTPYIGGDGFDLADFIHVEPAGGANGNAWPAEGRMRYLKLADDPAILDGQDWNPDWMTGARLMAAMGVNVESAE